jgi:CTP synthase (UTP-ammonia lyase)
MTAIRFAREQGYPFLGTCGGFQHALIEYARSVLGLTDAEHAETNPDAKDPFIAPLACALVNVTGDIFLHTGSRIALAYGVVRATEAYHCSYGLSPRGRAMLESGGMNITTVDGDGEI